MIRHQYSYWLDIEGKNATKAASLMKQDGTLTMTMSAKHRVQFQVNENLGVIEEWTNMAETLLNISKECPETTLSMLDINEETHEERRIIYRDGKLIKCTSSRTVGADDKYDRETVNDIIAFLKEHNHADAAKLIETQFLD